jgi:dTDP-4-dehydrorhamnose 3,5-epimerase-like enzyme
MHSFYCPVGFAHGFCVLSDVADVLCEQSNYHADETERGIAYDTRCRDRVAAAYRAAADGDRDSLPFRCGSR